MAEATKLKTSDMKLRTKIPYEKYMTKAAKIIEGIQEESK